MWLALKFYLTEYSYVKLCVYDGTGKPIKNLIQENLLSGLYSFDWDCRNDSGYKVPSGIYIISLLINNYHISK